MSPVHLEVKNHIAVVTLDFPPVNAVAAQAYVELTEIFDSLHEHPEARVAVLTGTGTKAFCAGADIKARVAGTTAPRADHGRTARETFNAIYECAIPVIGAINGPALGAGIGLSASCDYLIASENAYFALPEINVGLLGGSAHTGRLFPQGMTRRMFYTAERVSAAEAYRLGAVFKVVPSEKLMEEALAEAAIIAAKMPAGILLAKESMNMVEWMDLKNGYRFEQTRTALLQKTEDSLEAKKAFLEKRPPVFKGR